MLAPKIWELWLTMVSFSINVKNSVSLAFTYLPLLEDVMVRLVISIGGKSTTETIRIMLGAKLPAASAGAV